MVLGIGMASTSTIDTTDPDEFMATGRPVTDLTITERGQFRAKSVRTNLEHVWTQHVCESLACLKRVELLRNSFLLHLEPGPTMFVDGAEIDMNQVAVVRSGDCYNWRLAGATHWAAISLTDEDMETLCPPAANLGPRSVRGVSVFTPLPEVLARLRSMHEHVSRLAKVAPALWTETDLPHDTEDGLISAVQDVWNIQASSPNTYRGRHHAIIIARFRRALEAQDGMSFYLPAISQQIGVSGRTLRLACQQQLAMSPRQYIVLRRMQAVRRVLEKADPKVTHVTDVATEHGFWELGRFAVTYRRIFGEVPSATLGRAA